MRHESRDRPAATGYAGAEVTKPPDWHGLVVVDVFLNALATGLFLTAALADLAAPATFGPLSVAAYRLALPLLLADLSCLVLDLGNPYRFHHMIRVFKPLSPMSLGTWFLTGFSLPLTALVAIDLLPLLGAEAPAGARTALEVAALPLAFGAAAYKGVLFSTTAQPGWRDARWLGGYHTASALSLGAALLLGLAFLFGTEEAVATLRLAAGALLVVALVPLGLLTAEMWPALRRRYGPRLPALGGLVFVGAFVPLAAWAAGSDGIAAAGVVAALVVGFAHRYAIVMLPQVRPRGQ